MVTEIARLQRENALLKERNRLIVENAALKALDSLSVCRNCGARVRADRLPSHISERCPAVEHGLMTGGTVHNKTRKARRRQYTDEDRQAFFERSLRQGGLCDGR